MSSEWSIYILSLIGQYVFSACTNFVMLPPLFCSMQPVDRKLKWSQIEVLINEKQIESASCLITCFWLWRLTLSGRLQPRTTSCLQNLCKPSLSSARADSRPSLPRISPMPCGPLLPLASATQWVSVPQNQFHRDDLPVPCILWQIDFKTTYESSNTATCLLPLCAKGLFPCEMSWNTARFRQILQIFVLEDASAVDPKCLETRKGCTISWLHKGIS